MMWRRTFFLLEVLKRGYNFIFTVRIFNWTIYLKVKYFNFQCINFKQFCKNLQFNLYIHCHT
jgi:hypothetical protein